MSALNQSNRFIYWGRNTHVCIFIKANVLTELRVPFFSFERHNSQCVLFNMCLRMPSSLHTFFHTQTFSISGPMTTNEIFSSIVYSTHNSQPNRNVKATHCSVINKSLSPLSPCALHLQLQHELL